MCASRRRVRIAQTCAHRSDMCACACAALVQVRRRVQRCCLGKARVEAEEEQHTVWKHSATACVRVVCVRVGDCEGKPGGPKECSRGTHGVYSGGTNPVLTGYSCCAPVARRARRTETVRSVNTVNTHSCETAAPMKSANGSVGAEGCNTWRGGLHRAQRHMAGRVATCGGEMQRAHELRASQA